MTVQELLITEGFDNVFKALQVTHKGHSIEDIASYKEAFDIICNTQFEGSDKTVTFDVAPREHWGEPRVLPLVANNVEGSLWEKVVGMEVVRPEDNPFTDAELAGAILWGMTFYGFTQRDRHSCYDSMMDTSFTEYGKMARKLMVKRELPYAGLPDMKDHLLEQIDDMRFPFGLTMEEWDYLRNRKRHLNRSKRKRDYRLKNRISWLRKLDKRQNDINIIKKGGCNITPKLTNSIIKAGSILATWRESHTYGKSPRVDYIIELMSMNDNLLQILGTCDSLVVVCYTASGTPMSDVESEKLYNFIMGNAAKTGKSVTILFGSDDEVDRDDLALQFIGISKTIIEDDDYE